MAGGVCFSHKANAMFTTGKKRLKQGRGGIDEENERYRRAELREKRGTEPKDITY
jgi:hypothetical protein